MTWARVRWGLCVLLLVGIAALAYLYIVGTRAAPFIASGSSGATSTQQSVTQAGAAESVGVRDQAGMIEQGRYLATIGNCIGCHTVQGRAAYAGGTPLITPFGTLYGPNITPHREAGIGTWTADDFWRALHDGQGPGGRLLYPAFPYTAYTHVSRADADALFAFLMAQPPDPTPSKPHDLAFPYNQRKLLALWRGLYFKAAELPTGGDGPVVSESNGAGASVSTSAATSSIAMSPNGDAHWLRGRYLVEGLGHCAACHTGRNRLGASIVAAHLGGGMIDTLQWWAPALSNHPESGLGTWSEKDIETLLLTGVSDRGTAAGPMGEVISTSLQYLRVDDARAIAHYLKHLPEGDALADAAVRSDGRDEPPDLGAMQIGEQLYTSHCVQCHQAQGQGAAPDWPPLAGNISVLAPSPRNAIKMVLDGGFAPLTEANPQPHGMPPFSQVLSDNDVAALVTYIRNSWGNTAGGVNAFAVKRARGG